MAQNLIKITNTDQWKMFLYVSPFDHCTVLQDGQLAALLRLKRRGNTVENFNGFKQF